MSVVEEWRQIAGFGGLFEVSDQGNIRRLGRNLEWREVKAKASASGHMSVRLCQVQHHWRLVHRLVLEALSGHAPRGWNALITMATQATTVCKISDGTRELATTLINTNTARWLKASATLAPR